MGAARLPMPANLVRRFRLPGGWGRASHGCGPRPLATSSINGPWKQRQRELELLGGGRDEDRG